MQSTRETEGDGGTRQEYSGGKGEEKTRARWVTCVEMGAPFLFSQALQNSFFVIIFFLLNSKKIAL